MELIWVTKAEYLNDYKIHLVFNNRVKGVVDLENSLKGKIFEPLKDVNYFKQFHKNSWTIEWNCRADFAPEYLYDLVQKQ